MNMFHACLSTHEYVSCMPEYYTNEISECLIVGDADGYKLTAATQVNRNQS